MKQEKKYEENNQKVKPERTHQSTVINIHRDKKKPHCRKPFVTPNTTQQTFLAMKTFNLLTFSALGCIMVVKFVF